DRMGAGPLPVWRFVRGRARKTPVRPLLHQEPIADARCADSARNSADCALRAFLALKRAPFEGIMNRSKLMNSPVRFGLAAAPMVLGVALLGHKVFGQPPAATAQTPSGAGANSPAPAASQDPGDDRLFRDIYQEFYDTYRLGPADEIAIRVIGQPDYTVERAK